MLNSLKEYYSWNLITWENIIFKNKYKLIHPKKKLIMKKATFASIFLVTFIIISKTVKSFLNKVKLEKVNFHSMAVMQSTFKFCLE